MLVAFFVADAPSRNPDLNDQKIYQIKVYVNLLHDQEMHVTGVGL